MEGYAAAISLKREHNTIMRYLLDPNKLNEAKSIYKELESFQDFVMRLNSNARKKMSDSLERCTDAMRRFENQELDADSMMKILKKMRGEYHNFKEEDEEEEPSFKSQRVGLSDVWIQLKEDLIVPFGRQGVFEPLSLWGMAGIGKTALAREAFEDSDIAEWFDCHVWVSVGVEWKPDEITKAILAQVDSAGKFEPWEMGMRLKESLMDKRFLIVLDDVWVDEVLDYLPSSVPDSRNGSQVLITTRDRNVGGFPLEVRLLNKEESWHLLRDTLFSENSCPRQLVEYGKKVAEKCDGLPLTIVTVADLLSNAEEELDDESLWFDVATEKKHPVFMEAYDKISEILYPSYRELWDYHKACFLYMGIFPLKFVIPVSKLINLWIAEDMIPMLAIGTLEFHGAINLGSFSSRGLVMVHQISTGLRPSMSSQGIKTCRLHSSWWHFCQREARKTKFFHVLDCFGDAFGEDIQSQNRLSFHNNVLFAIKDVYDSIVKNCASTVQTLLCFGSYSQYMVPICIGLKLLQRLDALNIRFYYFPLEVLELAELKYLALTCNGELPPSISNLGKLHYLIIRRHSSIKLYGVPISYMPMEIWDMISLKYLHVMECDLPDIGDTSLPELTILSNVTTRSCNVLERVSNLKKLGIRIELTPDVGDPLCCFAQIPQASKLESLKCVVVNPEYKFQAGSFPCLPISLKKLSLCGLGYPWEEMSKIASLPNLETLKLRYNAFRGTAWEVELNNGFQKLHLLQIEDIDLVKLKIGHGSFQCLVVLKMKRCYKLQELHFEDHRIVQEVEVVDCNPLVERNIKKMVVENSGLIPMKFNVHYSWK